jgi:putative endonuclease
MHQYSVYILKCADNTLYTGITNELYRRLDEHENGRNPQCYTFNRRPVQLVFQQDFHFVVQAIAFFALVGVEVQATKQSPPTSHNSCWWKL